MEQFEQLIQTLLKKILKNAIKLNGENAMNHFKPMYASTLRPPEKLSGEQLTQHFLKILTALENIFYAHAFKYAKKFT